MKFLKLWNEHKGLFWYGVFGIGTTVINIITYDICSLKIGLGTVLSTITAWIIAVLSAFFTNRNYVFKSTAISFGDKFYEFIRFTASRLFTGIIDTAGMYFMVDVFGFQGTLIKIVMNVIVIILNYIASRKIVFK